MKKQILAAAMAICMAAGSVWCTALPAFGRISATDVPADSGYVFRDTAKLETDYVNGALILTWPSVAKDGTLLNQNPLASSESSSAAPGDPMGSWTQPYKGLIIKYNGYTPSYSANKVSISLTGDEDILMGVVPGEAEGCQTVLDYAYPSGTSVTLTGNKSHIDETVVASGLATKYKIEYSTDGVTYTLADTSDTFNTQKKLCLPVIDGVTAKTDPNGSEYIQDNKNTVFVVSQQVERFPSSVELAEGETYYIKIVPVDGSGNEIQVADESAFVTQVTAQSGNTIKVPAYPTVEGGGIWTTGGRSTLTTKGQVYVVTSLDDSVSNPQPGTLRYGLQKARENESVPLTIVFAVGGTIHIDPAASKSQRRFTIGSNITIAGQTAPGEGITVAGGTCNISGSNIIVRYIRFRLGEGYDLDGANAQGKNIVVDHCSFGWGVDETFSTKSLIDSTISYNIISSGLAMVNKNGDNNTDAELLSGENEAKHGMGSIMNGYDTTITHNIWANSGTRNPRFEGGFDWNNKRYENKMEFANNVIYNWGHMSCYGGDRGEAQVNFEDNYFKTGPNTLEKVKNTFFDCDTDSTYGNVKSSYYITGNIMEGNETLNADNTKGFTDLGSCAYKLDTRVELTNGYTPTDAAAAYTDVLENAGASFTRDAQDDRLIAQIKNDTGRFINSEKEAGGYITIENAAHNADNPTTPYDSDSDGIPDAYEALLGTDPAAADSTVLITDETSPFYGYTYLEIYINDILGEWNSYSISSVEGFTSYAAERTLTSDKIEISAIYDADGNNVLSDVNTDLILGKAYTLELGGGNASSLYRYSVLFNDEEVSSSLTFIPTQVGSYVLQAAVQPKAEGGYVPYTLSNQADITVLETEENIPEFTAKDIGAVRAAGNVSYDSSDGSVIIEGAGLVGRTSAASNNANDAFFFDYTEMTGDFDISAQADCWGKLDYYQKAGIMARASVDDGKPEFYWNTSTYIKGESYTGSTGADGNAILARNIGPFVRTTANGSVSDISASTLSKFLSVAKKRVSEEQTPMYMRMTRTGQTITLYGGTDGTNWITLASYETTLPETCYVGFAIDAVQDAMNFTRYNKAEFTNIVINGTALGEENPTPSENKGNGIVGDVDQNGIITANDAGALLSYVKTGGQSSSWNTTNYIADTNNDNDRTSADAAEILKKVLNSATQFERTNQ